MRSHLAAVRLAGIIALLVAAPLMGRAEIPGNVLRIGVLSDETGPTADNAGAGSVVAAHMAAEDAATLLPGIAVEVIHADHQNKPDVASAIAREWVQGKGVNVVADVPLSSAALAVNEVLRAAPRAVFIASGPGSSDLTGAKCSPNTIHWTYDTWALANAIARAMMQEGAKSWFFVTADYAFGFSLEKDTVRCCARSAGRWRAACGIPCSGPTSPPI